jgi:hypothetical protein
MGDRGATLLSTNELEQKAIAESGELAHIVVTTFMRNFIKIPDDIMEAFLMQIVHTTLATSLSLIAGHLAKAMKFDDEQTMILRDIMIKRICELALSNQDVGQSFH